MVRCGQLKKLQIQRQAYEEIQRIEADVVRESQMCTYFRFQETWSLLVETNNMTGRKSLGEL